MIQEGFRLEDFTLVGRNRFWQGRERETEELSRSLSCGRTKWKSKEALYGECFPMNFGRILRPTDLPCLF